MKKETCIVIKNGLTGEQIRLPGVQDLSTKERNAIIEAYTSKWTENDIGYYVSYLYEQ